MQKRDAVVRVSRKERERQRHRAEIVRTASRLFCDRGFHNVSMHEIAEKAGFAVGTLYNFFSNKEDLYGTLLTETAIRFQARLIKVIESSGDGLAKIRSYVATKIDLFRKNERLVRLYLKETQDTSLALRTSIQEKIKSQREERLKKLAGLFEQEIKKGVLRQNDPYFLAAALDGMTHALLLKRLEKDQSYDLNADLIFKLFFQSLYTDKNAREGPERNGKDFEGKAYVN